MISHFVVAAVLQPDVSRTVSSGRPSNPVGTASTQRGRSTTQSARRQQSHKLLTSAVKQQVSDPCSIRAAHLHAELRAQIARPQLSSVTLSSISAQGDSYPAADDSSISTASPKRRSWASGQGNEWADSVVVQVRCCSIPLQQTLYCSLQLIRCCRLPPRLVDVHCHAMRSQKPISGLFHIMSFLPGYCFNIILQRTGPCLCRI